MPLNEAERVQRGIRAAALMEDPLLAEAFEAADRRAVARWKDARTVQEREEAWAVAHALKEVQQELHVIVADGQHAQAKIDRAQPRKG